MTNSKDDRIDASSPAPELPVPVPDITRLPQPLTSFVDREIDAAKVASLLGQDGVRLVTLTGTDGVGKTRLALYVADEVASAFPDGVDYVSLSTVSDPEQVLPAIARSRQGTGASLGLAGPAADDDLTHEGLTLARQLGDMSAVARRCNTLGRPR